jgi:hypothetical protein
MKDSPSNLSMASGLAIGAAAVLGLFVCASSMAAAEPKKSAPAPHPAAPAPHAAAPAAHAAAPAGGAHGPTTSTAGHAAGAPSHAVTTSGAQHGVTTGGASAQHGGVTSGAGAKPATAGGYKPGGASAAHPGAAGTAGHSSFAGHPAPANSHEMHAANGAAVRTRADGSRSDVHDPKRGMDIHHGLNGNRHVAVERADHSRIVSERGGRGYVQHPYMYHGHEFGHRTYYAHGRAYDRFYGRYGYRGHYYDVYAPRGYYPYGFYGYAYAPWAAPVPYAWAPAPWVAPYGFYYAPYPVYPAPAFWLADFVFAASLAAAYEAGHTASAEGAYLTPDATRYPTLAKFSASIGELLVSSAEAAAASPALSPEVKQQVSDEIKQLVQQEGDESKTNGRNQDADAGADSVMKLLGDNRPHVFVAGSDLDMVSTSGSECTISQGDVLRVASLPADDAESVSAAVLASKGNKECAANSSVTIALSDLQDMHNHMRESVDDGLAELQKKQGTGGLPAAPAGAAAPPVPAAFAKDAPPPEANAGAEVAQQAKEADAAEQDVTQQVAATPAAAPAAGGPVNISVGQSIDSVSAALGSPVRIIDLGAKKIYSYKDMKIIFMNGKVSDVQ